MRIWHFIQFYQKFKIIYLSKKFFSENPDIYINKKMPQKKIEDFLKCEQFFIFEIRTICKRMSHMVCSMPNRTGSGLHVFDLLEILRIDRLT